MAKFGFSRQPWLVKQEQLRQIEANKQAFTKERRENKSWAKRKSFKSNPYLSKWAKQKDVKERVLTELAINSLTVCDAAAEVNEALLRGLGLKDTAIDMDAVEDLTYNIYVVKMAEFLCGDKGANLSKEVEGKVLSAIISQLFPPTLAQKQVDNKRVDKFLENLAAIKQSNK